ncbi:hypothetical protein DB347_05000 [Opitutaceae bacterium EW11]|nr:hypothetical protein DB347_05000 [Opitutaceae bacterium EW11]
MDRAFSLLRANPGLLACTLIAVIALVVTAVLAWAMIRAGVSLKPLVFFGVFLAIVLAPQLLYHAFQARGALPDLSWSGSRIRTQATDRDDLLEAAGGRFRNAELVFGPGFDPQLRADVRRLFVAPTPEVAERVVFPSTDSTMVARFRSPEEAWAGARYYAAAIGAELPEPEDNGAHTLRRSADWVRLLVAGRTLFVWASSDEKGLEARAAASAGCWSSGASPEARTGPSRLAGWCAALLVFAVLACATAWFFKGSSWAGSLSPAEDTAVADSAQLRDALLHLGGRSSPLAIEEGKRPGEVVASWRLESAWLDLAKAQGLRRIHKLVLQLDEPSRTVRVREFAAELDWTAQGASAGLRWQAQWGTVFFEVARTRSAGAVVGMADGAIRVGEITEVDFDLQKLKAPLIEATLRAGWKWKPVFFDAPPAARWFFE